MRQISLNILVIGLIFIIVGCSNMGDEDVIESEHDLCIGLDDCYIINDEDANEALGDKYRYTSYNEVTNIELQHIQQIVNLYQFDYFDTNMTELTDEQVHSRFWALTQMYLYSDLDRFDDRLYTFIAFLDDLNDFEIDELVENDKRYIYLDDKEHLIYKKRDDENIYYDIFDGNIRDTYVFNLEYDTLSSNKDTITFQRYKDIIEEHEELSISSTSFTYDFNDALTGNREFGYMTKNGVLAVKIEESTLLFRFLSFNQEYNCCSYRYTYMDFDFDQNNNNYIYEISAPETYGIYHDSVYPSSFESILFLSYSYKSIDSEFITWFLNTFTLDDYEAFLEDVNN